MASIRSRFSIATVVLAVSAMTAAPLAAAELPLPSSASPGVYDSHATDAFGYRRWRHHSGDHIRTGDAVAGVAILGVLAAIVGSANNDRRERQNYREPYREPVRPARGWNNGGIDNAVDQCVSQVERGDDRVGSVDSADRDSSGWRVQGSLRNGDTFTCRLDNEGRIRSIDLGDDFAVLETPAGAEGRPQLSDQAYAQARAASRASGVSAGAVDGDLNQPRPAYPGGPLPGEEGYEASLGG